jgi:hypothetical protein
MKKNPRAWSFLTIDGERRYSGNTGYADNPAETYRYDRYVANYKQVSEGDVIVLRSRSEVLGIARIEKILTGKGEKERLRCPHCGTTKIEPRTTMQPPWTCRKQHAFDAPTREVTEVETFAAQYGATFRAAPAALTVARLDDAVMRPSPQMSIKEIDLARIEECMRPDPACRELIRDYANAIDADPFELPQDETTTQSIIETRQRVLREINLRRGQRQFRERLISRYGAACQISRCDFPGLVEAAHIRPYAKSNENGAHNGLLLRSDLHTLFDLGLLAIHPVDMTVKLHPDLLAAGYATFDGKSLFVNGTSGPDLGALQDRWDLFQPRSASEGASDVPGPLPEMSI